MAASRTVKRLLAAVLVPAVLLVIAEVVVRLTVTETGTLVFQRVQRDGQVAFQRSPGKNLAWYPPYRKEKEPGALRVACIGGSTVEGNPFFDAAFPRVVESLLGRALAPRKVEVMAAGIGGLYSDGELALLRELLDFDLDAVVLYSCHNEFHPQNVAALLAADREPARTALTGWVERLALGRLLLRQTAVRERAVPSVAERVPDHRPIDGPEWPLVVEHFRDNLETFTGLCRGRGIPVMLCTAVSNLRDFPPLARVYGAATSEAERARCEALIGRAREAIDAGNPEAALGPLDEAAALDESPAGLWYQRGRALSAVGRAAEALAAFERARDGDGRSNRAPGALNAVVRSFAGRPGVLVADVEACFAARAPQGIVGDESIVDNVHPNLEGQRLIAGEILATFARAGVLLDASRLAGLGPAEDAAPSTLGPDEIEARIGRANLTLALEKGRAENTAAIALRHLQNARRLAPERVDVLVDLALLEGLAGRNDEARALLAQALARDASVFRPWSHASLDSGLLRNLFRAGGIRFEGERAVAVDPGS